MLLTKEQIRQIIAYRVGHLFQNGAVVTLGIGLPTMVADYIPQGVHVWLQSENGLIGMGPAPVSGQRDERIINSGGQPATLLPGGCYFDSVLSFTMIRGGHVDATVLGALEVDEAGNIANWLVPGKMVPGMGGAMDLIVGAQQVVVAMEHTAKGSPKIRKKCLLPLTAAGEANVIVTELGVIQVEKEGLILTELNPLSSLEELFAQTEASLKIAPDLKKMPLPTGIMA